MSPDGEGKDGLEIFFLKWLHIFSYQNKIFEILSWWIIWNKWQKRSALPVPQAFGTCWFPTNNAIDWFLPAQSSFHSSSSSSSSLYLTHAWSLICSELQACKKDTEWGLYACPTHRAVLLLVRVITSWVSKEVCRRHCFHLSAVLPDSIRIM